jgi:single-stranded-DNA-specific exonuclease
MQKAVDRLNEALGKKERILVYGDYDVDGCTAVALVYRFLQQYYSNIDYYIPSRNEEGYGVSRQGVDYAHETGVSLVIVLDCGIKAVEEIAYAKELGIDFIICDHHVPDSVLPPAVAILNAKREDSTYPYKVLCGCGVGFKFTQGFAINNGIEFCFHVFRRMLADQRYQWLLMVILRRHNIAPRRSKNLLPLGP